MVDSCTQLQLRERFNPDGSILRNMQLRMLEMLKYIDKICKDNDIRYWLSSGTCLGAIRHGGFIPWDDDCDIEMFRADFDKLKSAIIKDTNSPFKWQDHTTDPAYVAPYAKLRDTRSILKELNTNDKYYRYHGIYVDIFILEPSKSIFLKRVGNFFQAKFLFSLNRIKNETLRKFLIDFNWSMIHRIIFPLLNLPDRLNKNNDTYRHTAGSMFLKPRFNSSICDTIKVPFEGILFPVPANCETYLSVIYGDFNSIPDLEKIDPHISDVDFL